MLKGLFYIPVKSLSRFFSHLFWKALKKPGFLIFAAVFFLSTISGISLVREAAGIVAEYGKNLSTNEELSIHIGLI